MATKRLWIFRSALACLALVVFSGVASAQPVPSIGLVAPGTGWTVLNEGSGPEDDHLYWTNDDGGAWADITPHDPASREIAGVFFLDASRGWVLLAVKREPPKNNQEPDNFITDISGFDLASTTDGGATWTIRHLAALPEGVGWLANGQIFFLDAAHGWMNIESPTPHWGGEGILLSTNDGGNTLHLESWSNLDQAADLPIVAVVDSIALAPKRVDHEPATLLKLGLGGKVSETRASQSPEVPSGAGIVSLSFSDVTHGWASSSDGRLLSTEDGGTVWKDITPSPKKTSTQPASSPVDLADSSSIALHSSVVPLATPGPIAAASTISTYKSRHLGFDLCQAPPDSPQMSTWWTSSPYFDIGIYVGGSTRSCQQPYLISRWVTNVTGQGWGLIPLWPGPQVPCTCVFVPNGNNSWPMCTKFWGTYIDTSGGAYAQGQAEADAATKGSKSAMQKLGLGAGSVIYYDIENYTPSATCIANPAGSYVNSFLSGWVSEIQSNGYIAGVYGNAAPATSWYAGGTGYSAVSPLPNDVFIAS